MKIKNTKILTITILTIVYSSVIGLITISYFAKDEGTLGNSVILNFLADNLYFIAIPTFFLISILAKTGLSNIEFFSIGILISGLVYAILTVRIYSYFQSKKDVKNSPHKDYKEERA